MTDYNYNITGIFPTPVLISSIGREFSKKELDSFKYHAEDSVQNIGNTGSKEKYLFHNDPNLDQLWADCQNLLTCFVDKIYCPATKIEPYITQSWLNYTKEKQFHHQHKHPNSFISGVLYIDVDEQNDKIIFHNEPDSMLSLRPKEYNPFNCVSWTFELKPGMVILFPSTLSHSVEHKVGTNTRTSLAFNSFVRGDVGFLQDSTELKLA